MTDHKLKQGLVYQTIITHRKLYKLSTFIKCGKIDKMLKQDVIDRNCLFKRLVLSNYGIEIDKKSKEGAFKSEPNTKHNGELMACLQVPDNQLLELFSGKLC